MSETRKIWRFDCYNLTNFLRLITNLLGKAGKLKLLVFPVKKRKQLSSQWLLKKLLRACVKKKDVSVCPSCSAISKTEVSLFLFSKWFDERVQQIFIVIFKIEKTSNITLVLFMNKYHHFWLNFVLILNSEKLEALQLFSFIITLFFE